MLRLLRAELYKIFKGRTFKVLLIVALVFGMIPIIGNMVFAEEDAAIESQNPNIQIGTAQENKVEEEIVLGNLGMTTAFTEDPLNVTSEEMFYVGFGHGIIELFIAILVGALFANEYSQGTIKNILAYGKKRRDFYLAKFLGVFIGVMIITGIMTMTPTIINTLMKGWDNFSITQILGMGKSFLAVGVMSGATIGLVMIFSLFFKNNGPTIAAAVGILVIGPTFLSAFASNEIVDKMTRFTIFYNSTVVKTMGVSLERFNKSLLIGSVTLLITLLLGIMVFNKQDIK